LTTSESRDASGRAEQSEEIRAALTRHGIALTSRDRIGESLPLGCVVATAHIERVVRFRRDDPFVASLSEKERAFGDYTPGRYGFVLSNVIKFDEPIRVRGRQNIWEWCYPGDSARAEQLSLDLKFSGEVQGNLKGHATTDVPTPRAITQNDECHEKALELGYVYRRDLTPSR